MEELLKKFLEQQDVIITRQKEILSSLQRLEEAQNLLDFKLQRQHDELNSRLEINERSVRQIDEQIAISNVVHKNESKNLLQLAEELKTLEEFLKLDAIARLMDSLER